MERTMVISEDGSHTIYVPLLHEHYHSIHGALRESMHIFIHSGLAEIKKKRISLLEIGFGTGLNAWLSCIYAMKNNCIIDYTGIEKYPLSEKEWRILNYTELTEKDFHDEFTAIHRAEWDKPGRINEHFSIFKKQDDIKTMKLKGTFDLVYFDAFAPDVQPELWTTEVFSAIYREMSPSAILMTYSVKGIVRRTMEECGFRLERIPGPAGKRQILRAYR